ncbi:MAG TPA: amidohydrolase family protein [Acidimicrobiales bacterium]|nr:amidohydrolase family protein [Acidimicrobiales bacterium]
MTYAQGRTYYDADSHIMELPDWLVEYADPEVRDRIRPLYLGAAGKLADHAMRDAEARSVDPAAAAALEADLLHHKGWGALGAFDPVERTRALDLLGFDCQLVFSTFAPTQFLGDDPDLVYGGTRAHNRAMVDFCSGDPRLVPVGFVPWGAPERNVATVEEAIDLGCGAVLLPSVPEQGFPSPTHPDNDPVWRALEQNDVPFMLHIGGGGQLMRREFHDNGRKVTDFLGGGENIRSKDYMAIHMPPEIFLSCLVLDGIFERFPALRGGCIEQGAMWVVPWLKRLDLAQYTFRKTEPALTLGKPASEYVHGHLWFTPFPTEPVGWMIEQAGDDLFLFSSDYPHPEGGRDPLARFEGSMESTSDVSKQRFYADNFAAMMGSRVMAGASGSR